MLKNLLCLSTTLCWLWGKSPDLWQRVLAVMASAFPEFSRDDAAAELSEGKVFCRSTVMQGDIRGCSTQRGLLLLCPTFFMPAKVNGLITFVSCVRLKSAVGLRNRRNAATCFGRFGCSHLDGGTSLPVSLLFEDTQFYFSTDWGPSLYCPDFPSSARCVRNISPFCLSSVGVLHWTMTPLGFAYMCFKQLTSFRRILLERSELCARQPKHFVT